MKRKSQVAMEFLATYGWAILVVMIAIGALAYFGVLNPKMFLPDKCVFGAGIGCAGHAIYYDRGSAAGPYFGTGSVNATLVNGMGKPINVTNVNITVMGIEDGISTTLYCAICRDKDKPAPPPPERSNNMCGLQPPGRFWEPNEELDFGVICPKIQKGERPQLDVIITYKTADGKYTKEIEGVIQGKASS